jgi:hypothetical protein
MGGPAQDIKQARRIAATEKGERDLIRLRDIGLAALPQDWRGAKRPPSGWRPR